MIVGIWVLIALVAGGFVKGYVDMSSGLENGQSLESVIFGAAPMIMLGALSLLLLGKVLTKMSNDEQPAEDSKISRDQ